MPGKVNPIRNRREAPDKFLTGVGILPIVPPLMTPWGRLHTADDLFILTLFANNVPPALTNLNGSGATGTAAFTLPPASLNLPALDLRFIIQAITVDGRNNITGLSPRVDVVVRL